METEIKPAKRRHGKSGRRFNKFERELIATFEHSRGFEACREAIAIIRGEKTCDHLVYNWSLRQGSWQNRLECKLEALDRLLGTHGVELLCGSKSEIDYADSCTGYDSSYTGPDVEYLNAGDTYAATLIYDHSRAFPWRIACWGDYAERFCRFED